MSEQRPRQGGQGEVQSPSEARPCREPVVPALSFLIPPGRHFHSSHDMTGLFTEADILHSSEETLIHRASFCRTEGRISAERVQEMFP